MSSFVESGSKKRFLSKAERTNKEEGGGGEGGVSSQLFIKPAHGDEPVEALDKEAVLRRIKHQKRLNKVKNAVQALFSKSRDAADGKKAVVAGGEEEAAEKRWVDDPFSTL